MNRMARTSRRDFLKAGAAVSGGLVVGFYLPRGGRFAAADAAGGDPSQPFTPNAFLRIDPDDTITVLVGKSEMGQGVYTSLPMLIAEELEADWRKIRVAAAPVEAAYNHTAWGMQMTGGSSSIWSSYDQLRKAGATARMMLVEAAARTWQVSPADCIAAGGFVIHEASGRRLAFGQGCARWWGGGEGRCRGQRWRCGGQERGGCRNRCRQRAPNGGDCRRL